MTKTRTSLFLFIIIQLLLPTHIVFADIGPKPSMEFGFQFASDVAESLIESGILYECDQPDCSDAAPLEELGPQALYCEVESCRAIAYGFAPYHRLEIQFSDGVTRQSNIFETIDFDSVYLVTVNVDHLSVEEVSGSPRPPDEPFPPVQNPMSNISVGLGLFACICLSLILVIGLVVFLARRARKK